MMDFKIDEDRCVQCGSCSKDCPSLIIDVEKGIPEIKEGGESSCLKCQHCLAICPTGALSIWGKSPEDSVFVKGEIPKDRELEHLIRTRRSVRIYKDEVLPHDELQDLLKIAAYAPTGGNANNVLLTITETKEQLDKVKVLVYDAIRKAVDSGTLPDSVNYLDRILKAWDNMGVDILFRNAPHVIISSAPSEVENVSADGVISLSYFELYANTKGIGTLWDGLVRNTINFVAPDLKEKLGIPVNHVLGYVMVFGKPAVKYKRSVQSDGLHVNKVSLCN